MWHPRCKEGVVVASDVGDGRVDIMRLHMGPSEHAGAGEVDAQSRVDLRHGLLPHIDKISLLICEINDVTRIAWSEKLLHEVGGILYPIGGTGGTGERSQCHREEVQSRERHHTVERN